MDILRSPDNWQIERPLEYTYDREKHTIIPDAVFSKGSTLFL